MSQSDPAGVLNKDFSIDFVYFLCLDLSGVVVYYESTMVYLSFEIEMGSKMSVSMAFRLKSLTFPLRFLKIALIEFAHFLCLDLSGEV